MEWNVPKKCAKNICGQHFFKLSEIGCTTFSTVHLHMYVHVVGGKRWTIRRKMMIKMLSENCSLIDRYYAVAVRLVMIRQFSISLY